MPTRFHPAPLHPLVFIRHGATAPNLAGLRCGGDLDVPLTDLGREQARAAAARLLERRTLVDVIVTSALQRTVETAQIIARALGGVPLQIEPGFAERALGDWNLQSIAITQQWLAQGRTPEGGEARAAFSERIEAALRRVLPLSGPQRHPLLVGSKGVARVLRELLELPTLPSVGNAEIVELDLAPLVAARSLQRCTA